MTGRTLIKVCLAALGMGLASPALAADYDGQLPGEGFSGIGGCTYLRLDGGATMFDQANVDQAQVLGYDTDYGFSDGSTTGYSVAINEAIANTGFIEGGAGCQVSDSMRIEVTGGVRLKSSVSDPYIDSLSADLTSTRFSCRASGTSPTMAASRRTSAAALARPITRSPT
jgi:hypothetical protein